MSQDTQHLLSVIAAITLWPLIGAWVENEKAKERRHDSGPTGDTGKVLLADSDISGDSSC